MHALNLVAAATILSALPLALAVRHWRAPRMAAPRAARQARLRAGGCLCEAVRYEVRGPMRAVVYCHCSQCRRHTGHVMAATAARKAHFVLTRHADLRWFALSAHARRGFCGACGSTLFWDELSSAVINIAAGSVDPPTGLREHSHIFVGSKADYYLSLIHI